MQITDYTLSFVIKLRNHCGALPLFLNSLHVRLMGSACMPVCSVSVLSASLWSYGSQATRLPCPWGFSGQEYWSVLPCPPPRNLLDSGITPRSLVSPALTWMFFTMSTTWEVSNGKKHCQTSPTSYKFEVVVPELQYDH